MNAGKTIFKVLHLEESGIVVVGSISILIPDVDSLTNCFHSSHDEAFPLM